MPPKSTSDPLQPYFQTLLAYAMHVLKTRPGEVVAPTSISSTAFRKDNWQKIILDGRARGVPHLPNAATIDTWFPLFREYKRLHGNEAAATPATFRKGKSIPVDDAQFEKILAEELDDPQQQSDVPGTRAKSERSLRKSAAAAATRNSSVESIEIQEDDDDYQQDEEVKEVIDFDDDDEDDDDYKSFDVTRDDSTVESDLDSLEEKSRNASILQDDSSVQIVLPKPQTRSKRGQPADLHSSTIKQKQPRTDLKRDAADIRESARAAEASHIKKNSGGITDLVRAVHSIHFDNNTINNNKAPTKHSPQLQTKIPPATFRVAALSQAGTNATLPPPARPPSTVLNLQDTPFTRVELMKVVASGGQAVIFLARLPLDGNSLVIVKAFYSRPSEHELHGMRSVACTNYAIRLIGQASITRSMLQPFEHQLLSHEVEIGAFQYDKNNVVVGWCYERLHGDLESAILSKSRKIGNAMKQLVALQIGYFLRGVHSAGYIFRDLKPSNVLLNCHLDGVGPEQVVKYFLQHYPVVKVTDFGLVAEQSQSKKTRAAGTMGYMPAAQMERSDYDKSVDITAYAITVSEVLVEDLMYDASESDEDIEHEFRSGQVQRRMEAKFARHSAYIPSKLRDLLIQGVLGHVKDLKLFTDYFEQSLKQLAFSLNVHKVELELLSQNVNTPARPQSKHRPHDAYTMNPVPISY